MPERKGPLVVMAVALVLLLVGLFVMKELVEGASEDGAGSRGVPARI